MTRRVARTLAVAALLLAGLAAPAGAEYRDHGLFGTSVFGAGGPQAVAADAQGTVYATDPAANQVERFTRGGDPVSPGWRGSGAPDAPLSNPRGIDVDPCGTVYVADADRIARYS